MRVEKADLDEIPILIAEVDKLRTNGPWQKMKALLQKIVAATDAAIDRIGEDPINRLPSLGSPAAREADRNPQQQEPEPQEA